MKPLVSIILPTYNRAEYLVRSIKSVLNQTFADFELIIVDDASTDNSKNVIDAFNDQRIVYLRHEQNKGGSAARNTGIREARGDFIGFQDSDDEWLPEKLEKQVKLLVNSPPVVGVAYTGFWLINGDTKEYIPGSAIQVKEGNIHRELLRRSFVTTQAVLVKKECFQKAGMFDETLPRLQDWDLFLRISQYFEFLYISEPQVLAYFTEGSISSKPTALMKALEIIIDKNILELKSNPDIYSGHLVGLSILYKEVYEIRKCRDYLIRATKANCRLGLILATMASFFGITFLDFYLKLSDKILKSQTKS